MLGKIAIKTWKSSCRQEYHRQHILGSKVKLFLCVNVPNTGNILIEN